MSQEKSTQERLLNTIKAIIDNPKNEWFSNELRKLLGVSSEDSILSDDERMYQIYEYCVEKIMLKHAEDFYKDFPLKQCIPSLRNDFARMESFRRKDNFGDFCLSLYQQIECINNYLCESKRLSEIVNRMWKCSPYVLSKQGCEISIEKRCNTSNYSIASLIFPGERNGVKYSETKPQTALQEQYASDKCRIIVYFLGYQAKMKNSDYDDYVKITSLLSEIYTCRNMNHRGSKPSDRVKRIQDKIMPFKSFYYFKFIGVLVQYVEFIKSGYKNLTKLEEFSRTL